MSQYSKKEFPSQTENRKQWIIDTVRNNQEDIWMILHGLNSNFYPDNYNQRKAIEKFWDMHKHDRDALLVPGGILSDDQIEILSPGRLSTDTEADQ